MVCTVVYSQMPVVVATFLAILAFITSCFYSILNSAKNDMSTAYFECITFWTHEARRSKKQEEAVNENTDKAEKEDSDKVGRLLRRANWCAGRYKDFCIIVRWWFSSVILMLFCFLFIMAALTFSKLSYHEFLIFGFVILFFLSIIAAVIAIIAFKIKHLYKSKLLNWKILWDKIGVFNPNLADDKFEKIKEEVRKLEKSEELIRKYPKWFEDNETESSEF